MRLPLVPQLSTKDGVDNSNARLTNSLKEVTENGEIVCVRPGLRKLAEATGNGKGLVAFNDQVISVYGSTLKAAEIENFSVEYGTLGFPDGEMVYALAGSGAVFVALRNGADAGARSVDGGVTWTSFTLPDTSGGLWDSVAYGNGKFVAFSDVGIGAYSTDNGQTWTQTVLPSSRTVNGCVWGNNKFVAVFSGTQSWYSTDGITWSAVAMPASAVWYGVAWNGSVFCSVGRNSSLAATSSDGVSWTLRTIPASLWEGIAALNGLFCAVASPAGTVITSTDGITWNTSYLPDTLLSVQKIAASSFCFLVVGYTNEVAFSTDGDYWDVRQLDGDETWVMVASGGSSFCVTSNGTTYPTSAAIEGAGVKFVSSDLVTGDFFDFAQSTL